MQSPQAFDPLPAGSHPRRGCGFRAAWGAAGAILAITLGLILLEGILTAIGSLLIIADPLVKADAVAVLSGGGQDRLQEGAKIYLDKLAQYYILTETGASILNDTEYTSELKLEVMQLGVPSGAILVTEKHAQSTLEEAAALKNLLRQSNLKSCTVVTDPFHTYRTRLIFRDVFRSSNIQIYVRPVRGHWYRSTTWWTSMEGIRATFSEYAKLIAYLAGIRRTD